MVSLFVGLGQVISYINESERVKQTGLYMVPDLEQYDIGVFFYNSDPKYKEFTNKYVDDLNKYLENYRLQSKDYQNCTDGQKPDNGKWCQFNLNWLGTNCTKENGYGYNDGNPCILFAFRNVKNWMPNITDSYLKTNADLMAQTKKGRQFDQNHLPLTCTTSYTTGIKLADEGNFKYYPESGFNLTFLSSNTESNVEQLPPLVFVQFVKPPYTAHPQINIKCQIWASNTDVFRGVRMIEFEFDDTEDIQGGALERP